MRQPETAPPDYPQYPGLLAQATLYAKQQSMFIDPRAILRAEQVIGRRGADWATSVLGFSYWGLRNISTTEMYLLLCADEADITPSLPADVAAHRQALAQAQEDKELAAAQRAAAVDAEWAALLAALTGLGIEVAVAHNYKSGRHCESGFVQGADHILPQVPFTAGRLARLQYQAFCATRSTEHNLYFPYAAGDPTETVGRRPTCKRCIRLACKITSLQAPAMLGQPHANGFGHISNRSFKATQTRKGSS